MRSKVAEELEERLAAIAVNNRELARDRSRVLRKIRESMAELRTRRRRPGPDQCPLSAAEALQRQFGLTRREVEVALLLAEGRSNAGLSQALRISLHTTRHHVQHVLAKLHVRSRSQVAALLHREVGGVPHQTTHR
jgi:DNA-binding CsgD family transcriptional regulator